MIEAKAPVAHAAGAFARLGAPAHYAHLVAQHRPRHAIAVYVGFAVVFGLLALVSCAPLIVFPAPVSLVLRALCRVSPQPSRCNPRSPKLASLVSRAPPATA